MTDSYDEDVVFETLAAGARGFVCKCDSTTNIAEAIRLVAAGEAFLTPPIIRLLLDRFAGRMYPSQNWTNEDLASLTDREREVLALIAEGRSSADVADRLYVSEATVKSHIHRVFRKLGLRNRVQAAIAAYEAGLADPSDADLPMIASLISQRIRGRATAPQPKSQQRPPSKVADHFAITSIRS